MRKLTWGDGPILNSPADVSRIIETRNATEDDILHAEKLPRFQNTLSAEESELLMSFLTVPYMRIPLVVGFFADLHENENGEIRCGDRVTYLFNSQLQALLRAVLFEQVRRRRGGGLYSALYSVVCEVGLCGVVCR